jgi:hypothetical protein
MTATRAVRPIVVYVIDHHPLEAYRRSDPFRWLHTENGYQSQLQGLIGGYEPDHLSILVDQQPAGPAWRRMLRALVDEHVQAVVTHLAPLSPAQRQQLIGVCAQTGAQLITPGDAGRNRAVEAAAIAN